MDKTEISQIDTFLYLGPYKHPMRQTPEFLEKKIDVIINCCNDVTFKQKNILDNYTVLQYPIDDGVDGTLKNFMDEIVDKINYFLNLNKKVYVHCVHGMSRSPSIIIYYLMKYKKLSFDQAFQKVKLIRPVISINSNFEKELRLLSHS